MEQRRPCGERVYIHRHMLSKTVRRPARRIQLLRPDREPLPRLPLRPSFFGRHTVDAETFILLESWTP